MRQLFIFLMIAALALLSGCAGVTDYRAGAGSGMASYELTKTATDGSQCRVRISSGREVAAGTLVIGKDCTLKAQADGMTGADAQLKTLDVINNAIHRIPGTGAVP